MPGPGGRDRSAQLRAHSGLEADELRPAATNVGITTTRPKELQWKQQFQSTQRPPQRRREKRHPIGGWASAAQFAGPAAVLSLVGTIAAIVAAGSDDVAALKSPVMIAAGVAGLVAVILLAFALIELALRMPVFRSGRGMAGALAGGRRHGPDGRRPVVARLRRSRTRRRCTDDRQQRARHAPRSSSLLAGIGWFAVGRTLFSQAWANWRRGSICSAECSASHRGLRASTIRIRRAC